MQRLEQVLERGARVGLDESFDRHAGNEAKVLQAGDLLRRQRNANGVVGLRRLTGGGDVWFGESVIHYTDGKVVHGVTRVEFRDGRIWRETRYYAEPFEAPAWRSAWVERIEEPVAG